MRPPRAAPALVALLAALACAPAPLAEVPFPGSPEPSPTEVARPQPAPAPPAVVAAEPDRRTVVRSVGGIDFVVIDAPADLFVEVTIDVADTAVLSAQVTADVREVEREFDRRFAARPVVYVFATTASYQHGMVTIFGYPGPSAIFIAENSVSFFEPPLRIIGVNWEAVRERRPVAAIRHELTHDLTLDACGTRCDLVPAWLNEGQGRLAEALIPDSDWRLVRVRYEAASMATTGTLIPLERLVSQFAWNSLTDWAGYYKYQQAARVTELLRQDVGGPAPIARIYERIRRGESIAQAYSALTGKSFDAFVAGLAARIAATAPSAGIVATTSAGSPGASYLLYGFAPSSTVSVVIIGPRRVESSSVTVSPFGAAFDVLSPDLPRGRYVISATSGDMAVTATVTKRTRSGPTRAER